MKTLLVAVALCSMTACASAPASEDAGSPPQEDAAPTPEADAAPTPPVDAGVEPDASGPACVESIRAPTDANPYIWVGYVLNPTTFQGVPYLCPDSVTALSCRHSFEWSDSPLPSWRPTTCRVAVPTECLPCTGGVTEW